MYGVDDMKNVIRRLLCLLLIVLFLIPTGCTANADKNKGLWYAPRDCAYFEPIPLEIPSNGKNDSTYYSLTCACATDKQIAMILTYHDSKTALATDTEILYLDTEGQIMDRFSLASKAPDFQAVSARYDKNSRLCILGTMADNSQEILLLSGSKLMDMETVALSGFKTFYSDFLPAESGWVLLGTDRITLVDAQAKNLADELLGGEAYGSSFVSRDGTNPSVLVMQESGTFSFLSVDPVNLSVVNVPISKLSFPSELDPNLFAIHGPYASNDYGVYSFNNKGEVSEVANWNRIDVPLPRYEPSAEDTIVLNDNLIIRNFQSLNRSGSDDIVLLVHRDQDPNAGKPTLTIGGYGVSTSLMKRAVFYYNTGDYPYRVALVEYRDKYPFTDANSMVRAKAEILADMSSGKGDDMYAGIEFDFDQWGDAGQVIDMSSIFENTDGEYLPCLTNLNRHNDKIYKVFPSFSMWGYIGYSDVIGKDSNLTIGRINEINSRGTSDQRMLSNETRSNLAIDAIWFRMQDFMTEEGFSITEEELQTIMDYASLYGSENSSGIQSNDMRVMYATGQLLLENVTIPSPEKYWESDRMGTQPMTLYGMPSLYESARALLPQSVIAISSGTEDSEACIDFIRVLLSDEVQEYATEVNGIPVSCKAFEQQIQTAMLPTKTTDGDLTAIPPMTAESAELYRESIASLNYIYIVNIDIWSLLRDECESYFTEGKSIASVRESMMTRMNLYLDENAVNNKG